MNLFAYLLSKDKVSGQNIEVSGDNLSIRTTGNSFPLNLTLSPTELTQSGTASPDNPATIHTITGNNIITVSDRNNTSSQTYPLTLGSLEYCKLGEHEDKFIKNENILNVPNSSLLNSGITTHVVNGKFTSTGITSRNYYNLTDNVSTSLNIGNYTLCISEALTHGLKIRFRTTSNTTITKTITAGTTSTSFTLDSEIVSYYLFAEGGISADMSIDEEFYCWLVKGDDILPYIEYGSPKWYLKKSTRKLELAIADMNNEENYPGWKNQQQLYNDYPNNNASFSALTEYLTNVSASNTGVRINTSSGNKLLYLQTSVFNLNQTEWKTNYPNLIFIIYYGLQTPEYVLLNETLQTELDNIASAVTYKNQTNVSQINEDLPFVITASTMGANTYKNNLCKYIILDNDKRAC